MEEQYSRRPADLKGWIERRQKACQSKNIRNFRTRLEINQRLFSSVFMRLASDSARGDLGATVVYKDLLPHIPNDTAFVKFYRLPEWRYLSSRAKVCFYQLGAASIETQTDYIAVPFSFNLSKSLWRAAEGNKKPDVTYLQHRLKTSLKRALNRAPEFWFAYEVNHRADNTGSPHLHGTILLTHREYKKARKAFHQINEGGTTAGFKNRVLVFSSGRRQRDSKNLGALHINLKWALYCMKERGFVRFHYLVGQKTIAATRGITHAAKQYHDQLRQAISHN